MAWSNLQYFFKPRPESYNYSKIYFEAPWPLKEVDSLTGTTVRASRICRFLSNFIDIDVNSTLFFLFGLFVCFKAHLGLQGGGLSDSHSCFQVGSTIFIQFIFC